MARVDVRRVDVRRVDVHRVDVRRVARPEGTKGVGKSLYTYHRAAFYCSAKEREKLLFPQLSRSERRHIFTARCLALRSNRILVTVLPVTILVAARIRNTVDDNSHWTYAHFKEHLRSLKCQWFRVAS